MKLLWKKIVVEHQRLDFSWVLVWLGAYLGLLYLVHLSIIVMMIYMGVGDWEGYAGFSFLPFIVSVVITMMILLFIDGLYGRYRIRCFETMKEEMRKGSE